MLVFPSNPSYTPRPAPDGPLVLVVEDDEDTRFLYAESLEYLGYRVVAEANAARGIEAAVRLRPDAIMMDLSMPGMSGIEAIRELKANSRTRDCLIVVVTGSGMKWFDAAREAGCDVFCGKPFEPSAIAHVLPACRRRDEKPSEPTLPGDVVKRCRCGREHTRSQWRTLAPCGRMHLVRRRAVLELRNCGCGSTLALKIAAPEDTGDDSVPYVAPEAGGALDTIVVAEKDDHVRRLLLHFVGSAYLVEFAEDGYAALDRVRRAPPTALVAEIMIPRLDGLALCRLLKGDSSTAKVPVLLFSVLDAGERATQAGADAFLAKPLERPLFIASLVGLADRHE
ncbi:MAG: response regulator [Polyangiaceae bacterium]